MKKLPVDFDELQKKLELDRQELEEMAGELGQLGRELRTDYIEQVLKPRLSRGAAKEGNGRVNRMCARCFNCCKQPESARIFQCNRYEPLE
ncbi:MAG: hypothetical protein A3F83_05195 [Candidatus Glassbacteria bacterium RIFCSPLOWO2_12_FULL_58_11]|uniref:Uncharacterized protein n=1 Tax=Candidatus Glassbacteria bacterium RIFCSPLOWO2_12_FULL_58_11 TaxID=1817867 RepID=A0A1F5Z1G6_9BACT|nr:MAG: hypothetical protein A3F83_05195 [Candidatus Glassbacteria bacterium RIFCSPLOWO2_12_FULL_58_11]